MNDKTIFLLLDNKLLTILDNKSLIVFTYKLAGKVIDWSISILYLILYRRDASGLTKVGTETIECSLCRSTLYLQIAALGSENSSLQDRML